MRSAGLPEAFTETIETGWWTSCLQILPPAERSRGRFQLYRSELAPGDDHDGLEPAADDDADRPVVALFGTALFPRRLRIDDRLDPQTAEGIREGAAAAGFVDIAAGSPSADVLTATVDGWCRGECLAPLATPIEEVKRRVVEGILARAQDEGSLPRPYGCAVSVQP